MTTCVERDPTSVHALDRHRWLPLFHAALRRRESVVRYLLEHGSDVGAREGLALHLAAEVPDNRSVIAMLLQHGALEHHARPTGEPQRQLLTAIFLGDAIAVDQKLRADPSLVRSSDGRGYTPLHRAAQHGDLRIMTALIAHGADVNATTARGDSVLYCVAGHGHLDGVSLLLANGAQPSGVVCGGGTTLSWLRLNGGRRKRYRPIIELLERAELSSTAGAT